MEKLNLFFFLVLLGLSQYSCNESSTTTAPLIIKEFKSAYVCPYCDLDGHDFSNQDLTNANLVGAKLQNANFSGAILDGVQFSSAKLQNANFSNAKIGKSAEADADFISANLVRANFAGANIGNVDFQYSIISCVDFSNCDLRQATFGPRVRFNPNYECQPIFRNTYFNCDLIPFQEHFDMTGARLPDCNDANSSPDSIPSFQETVWVDQAGKDQDNCGSESIPCASIGYAINRCNTGDCGVLVNAGIYQLASSIDLKEGVNLIGSFHDFEPVNAQSELIGPKEGSPLIKVFNINKARIEGFILRGTTPEEVGSNASSLLMISNSSGVDLKYINVIQAQGVVGTDGNDSPAPFNGMKGDSSTSITTRAYGGSGGHNNSGGAGGVEFDGSNSCDIVWLIGCEWESDYKYYSAENGSPGSTGHHAKGGSRGSSVSYICPFTERPGDSSAGEDGKDGDCGDKGISAEEGAKGSFSEHLKWQGSRGGDSTGGGHGGGGGGGGSGGFCAYADCICDCDYYLGTPGGGGGGGGSGAQSSQGGSMGGASFGFILHNSVINFEGTRVIINGGAGGKGGKGGDGKSGGKGGKGGSPMPSHDVCNDTGGQGSGGGDGGDGGASGGAAGGNGAPCYGIVKIGNSEVLGDASPIIYVGTGGAAGAGGLGGAKDSGKCAAPKGEDGKAGNANRIIIY